MPRTARWLCLPTIASLVLVAAACSGDEEGGSTDTASTSAATTATATDAANGGSVSTPTTSSQSGDSEDIDTCSLLTAAEVEAAIGVAVNDGAPNLLNTCDWSNGDPDEISVTVALISLPASALDVCATALAGDEDYEEVSAVGDGAFGSYNPALGGLADVVVCTAEGQLQIIVNGGLDDEPDEEQLRDAAEQLAQLVLERI